VPSAVATELGAPPSSFIPMDVSEYTFIEVRDPSDRGKVDALLTRLDRGEAEAIVLAQEVGAGALLIDEPAARNVATEYGLDVIGTLGVLLAAKQNGLIEAVGPQVERLRTELRFFVTEELVEYVIGLAGETENS
jgi:predicted nucleic acid-binding protein